MVLCGEDEGLFTGACFDDGVALTGEVFGDDGADAGVVITDQDGAFASDWRDRDWRELYERLRRGWCAEA